MAPVRPCAGRAGVPPTPRLNSNTHSHAMPKYIHSTATSDLVFSLFDKVPKTITIANSKKDITIKGGANRIDKFSIATPRGMVTEISDEDWEILSKNKLFKEICDNGFLKVMDTQTLSVDDMEKADRSAQLDEKSINAEGDRHVNSAPHTVETDAD